MRRLVATGLLCVWAVGSAAAQSADEGLLVRGGALLSAGRYLEAADTYQEDLAAASSRFTVQVAVYCDVTYLERQLRGSGTARDLFVLHRTVRDQSCYGLYWGLFGSRSAADAASRTAPPALQTLDRVSTSVSAVLASIPRRAARAVTPRPSNPLPPAPSTGARKLPPLPEPEDAGVSPAPAGPAAALPPLPPAAAPSATRAPARAPAPPPATLGETVTSPRVEIGLAYAYLWDDSLGEMALTTGVIDVPLGLSQSLKLGGVLSLTVNVTRRLGIVGEASGHDGSQDLSREPPPILTVSPTISALHGGLRYTDRDDPIVTPYAQVLAGATRLSLNVEGVSTSATHASIQPGLGVTVRLSEVVGFGIGGDYRWVIRPERDANEFRLHAGLVVRLGQRISHVEAKP